MKVTSSLFTLAPAIGAVAGAAIADCDFPPSDIIEKDVVIIGGGASGTYAAVMLREEYNVSVQVVEIKDRLVRAPRTHRSNGV